MNTRIVFTLTTRTQRPVSHQCIDLVHSLSHSHSQCHSHRLIRGLALHSNQFSQSFVAKSIANSVVSQSAARLNTSQDMPPVTIRPEDDIRHHLDQLITGNKVVVFSTTTCPFCAKVCLNVCANGVNQVNGVIAGEGVVPLIGSGRGCG